MRRGLATAVALMVMLSLAVPAGAKGKPSRATEYLVTMTVEGGDAGLATSCSGEPFVMTGNLNGVLRADGAMVEMVLPTVNWWRDFDAGWGAPTVDDPAHGFVGCHGGSDSADATGSFPGALWLTFGKDSSGYETVEFLWRFDYYWQFREETQGSRKRPKTVYVQEVLEIFELTSDELRWQADGSVSGPVSVTLFTKTEAHGVTHAWESIGSAYLDLNLTIAPR